MLAQHLQKTGALRTSFNRLIDVGVGGLGLGILWLVKAEKKYGLDPLPILRPETGCDAVDDFVRKVQSGVTYIQARAEALPFEDDFFDFIVCNNVLDHVHDPFTILGEIKRCMTPGGLFAFSVDTHSIYVMAKRKIMKIVWPNYGSLAGHPYEWTEKE